MRRDNQKRILKWLLEPIGVSTFFEEYYEKNFLLIQNRNPKYYTDIIKIEDIDNALRLNNIPYQKLYMIKDGIRTSINHWATVTPKLEKIELDLEKILNNLEKGHSLSLNGIQSYIPKLKFFTDEFNAENNIKSTANVYMTPNTARAFNKHYDKHELFVLQLEGTKHWKIYDMVNDIPDVNSATETIDYKKVKLLKEVILQKGDLLYIPRGMAHEAITTDTLSVHLTLGWYMPKMFDVLQFLQEESVKETFFRKSIASALEETPNIEELKQVFIKNFDKLINNKTFEDYIKATYQQFQKNKFKTTPKKGLTSFVRKHNIDENTIIAYRKDLVFTFEQKGIFQFVLFSGREEKFPLMLQECIKYIFSQEEVVLKDLPGILPMSYKITVVKNLLDKGMIEIVS